MDHRTEQTNFTKPGTWDQEGYICSNYFKDQMSAIVHMCELNTNRSAECGPYQIDLAAGAEK